MDSAAYHYRDEHGILLYTVYRGVGKAFRQEAADGSPTLKGVRRVPYRLPALVAAIREGSTIVVVEGEKDAENLAALGYAVTTNSGGSSYRWPENWRTYFEYAKRVVVIADCDKPGRKAATDRAGLIADVCDDVRLLDLDPNRSDGFDASDLLAIEGGSTALAHAIESAPPFKASIVQPQDEGPSRSPSSELAMVRLDTVVPERVEWLWRSRVPLGKVSLLVGDPGGGKSFVSLAIAAAVTTGTPLPDSDASPAANVIAYNAEDGLEDTVRPRAELCGVALDRIHAIRGTENAEGRLVPFALSDTHRVVEAIERLGNVRLVIIDPIASLLAGVDSHRDAEVRASLQVLVELATKTRAAVLVIMHLRKSAAERALYRVGGSIGFTGLARSVLLAGVDPDDGRRAIVPIKQNLAAPVDPVEYRLDTEGRFWWGQIAPELTSNRLLGTQGLRLASALDTASAFLEECLGDGERSANEIERLAKEAGISVATLKRAKDALNIKAHRAGFGKDGRWLWSLPIDAQAVGVYGEETPSSIDAHTDAIDAQASPLSAYGDSMSTYDERAPERGGLSLHGKLCRSCKTLGLAFDMGDGTWQCQACAGGAA